MTKTVLSRLGFKDARFAVKKAASKYYAPNSEMEVFVMSNGRWIEVGDQGLYSPVALANYDIAYPVFNVGFGVERLAMLLSEETDVRRLACPQFYKPAEYSDQQIAETLELIEKSETDEGRKIAEAIVKTALRYADEKGPCLFPAYREEIAGRKVDVYVYEPDSNVKLMGPAAFNYIYVYQGNILGIPKEGLDDMPLVNEAREKGVLTGLRYLDAIASMAASRIEKEALQGPRGEIVVRTKIAKLPSDVNIKIPSHIEQYISGRNKKIILKGPTFIGVKANFT